MGRNEEVKEILEKGCKVKKELKRREWWDKECKEEKSKVRRELRR